MLELRPGRARQPVESWTVMNGPGKSICGRLAINKPMQGKSCSCCLLLVPAPPPQACHVEKVRTCQQDGAIPACTNSLVSASVALGGVT